MKDWKDQEFCWKTEQTILKRWWVTGCTCVPPVAGYSAKHLIRYNSLQLRVWLMVFQCNEKEAEILSLATKIEVLKLKNREIQSEQSNEMYKVKTQVQ